MNRLSVYRAVLVALLVAAALQTSAGDYRPGAVTAFDGTWEGKLRWGNVLNDTDPWDFRTDPIQIRIVIKGKGAQVYTFTDGKWGLVKKRFRLTSHRTNAVITAIDSARDADGGWVETWTLLLSQISWRQIQILFNRQVNNEDLPRDNDEATWWHFGYGTLDLQDRIP